MLRLQSHLLHSELLGLYRPACPPEMLAIGMENAEDLAT